MNVLQDLVLTRLAELGTPGSPMSIREATRRSNGLLTYETLRKLARGEHSGDIEDKTAQGIASALQVPVQDVYAAANIPAPLTRWMWPQVFDRLDLEERRSVESVARAILSAREKGARDGG